ncbi:MAG: Ribosome biosis GTPase [Pseudomonadota bacterium]|nr:Ribosome biosis GTPase [Pseudomonadota bacterium]
MTIQWFPGHMNKAKLAIKELVADIDIVIELLDARAPFSSCNPLIQNIIQYKKKIRLLNKSDLSDAGITRLWLEYFQKQDNTTAITADMNDTKQRNRIIRLCRELAPNRNSFEKPLRVMITGIPNVGKSTLINQLIGKKSAKTGDIPAVTKANQCLTLADDFLIYDTPGMTWQKIHYAQVGYHLALCNSIGRNALDEEICALYLINYLKLHYPQLCCNRYKLKSTDLALEDDQILELIGKKRGCIIPGGIIDYQRTGTIIIQDFREGKIGQISLETPDMWEKWIKESIQEEQQQLNSELATE